MKTAISIPDKIFQEAEVWARRSNISRSALFTAAVSEYIQRRRLDDVTKKLNEVYAAEPAALDPLIAKMQALSIEKEEWE